MLVEVNINKDALLFRGRFRLAVWFVETVGFGFVAVEVAAVSDGSGRRDGEGGGEVSTATASFGDDEILINVTGYGCGGPRLGRRHLSTYSL